MGRAAADDAAANGQVGSSFDAAPKVLAGKVGRAAAEDTAANGQVVSSFDV